MSSAATNRILSLLFGPEPTSEKRKALETLHKRFVQKAGHELHPNNVVLAARSRTDTPFVLSLSLDGAPVVDLYAQGIEVLISTVDGLPSLKLNFLPAITINVENPFQISYLIALWFEAFKRSDGHMSEVAKEQGKTLTADSYRNVSWPKRQLLQASVHSVRVELGVDALVVTIDLEVSSVFGEAIKALAGLKKDTTIVKRVGAGRYEISRQIPLTAEHGACAAYLGGDADKRDACLQSINSMWLVVSRSGLDPVILKALGSADLGHNSVNEVELQIRSDMGEVYDREIIRFGSSDETTVEKTARLVADARAGKLDVLSAIEAVGRAWQAHAPSF